jgi:superfamily II DNA/RNA helicase
MSGAGQVPTLQPPTPPPPLYSTVVHFSVENLVLDEADKLFELGLLEQTDEILAACSSQTLQKALFSATIPAGVEQLARSIMKNSLRVIIGQKSAFPNPSVQS